MTRSFCCRDPPDHSDRNKEAREGADRVGERRSFIGLPDAGRCHRRAPGGRAQEPGSHEDPAGARCFPELQGRQGAHPALPDGDPQRRAPVHGDAAPRPRHHRGAGPPGVAGSASGT